MAHLKIRSQQIIENAIPCGTDLQFNGGESFPSEHNIVLGSGIGVVDITCIAYSIPDKFVFSIDGEVVLDTGYLGDTTRQNNLNSKLTELGLPIETIKPNSNEENNYSFQKLQAINQVLNVKVYAPLEGTAWGVKVTCPNEAKLNEL